MIPRPPACRAIGMRRLTDGENWPRLVQLAWQLHTPKGSWCPGAINRAPGRVYHPFQRGQGTRHHHRAGRSEGIGFQTGAGEFGRDLDRADYVMGHNIGFRRQHHGGGVDPPGPSAERVTNKARSTPRTKPPNFAPFLEARGGKFKWPTLTELHQKLFGTGLWRCPRCGL